MKNHFTRFMTSFTLFFLIIILCCGHCPAADKRSVYGATPPSTFTIYALDPDLLAAWNTPLRDYEKKFILPQYQSLPVLGGWYGEGFIPDREVLLASGLKKAFYLSDGGRDKLKIVENLEKLGMDVVALPGQGLKDTAECFRQMGKAFNREERGGQLAVYAERVLDKVTDATGRLPNDKRIRTYVALETDGLATICRGSERSEALDIAGALNVHECLPGSENASLRITFEQLVLYDPEVILVYHPDLMRNLPENSQWRHLSAMKNGCIYFIPRGPFSWLERPASYMRLIGVQWLANKLHPELYDVDIKVESGIFMKLFFNLDLDEGQLDDLFIPYGTF